MSPHQHTEKLGRVLIAGLGKTGLGLAEWCVKRLGSSIEELTVYGGAASKDSPQTQELVSQKVRVVLGSDEVKTNFDLAICAPGIPETSDFYRSIAAHAQDVIGEPEFAWRQSPDRWLAITGSNGKTTATYLLRDLLRAGGLCASEVGNIGRLAILACEERQSQEWFAAELSSFQLAGTKDFHPQAAALLNISPDHLSWHGSFEAYVQAKERIFSHMQADELCVVSIDDEHSRAIAHRLEARGLKPCLLSVCEEPRAKNAAFVRAGSLILRQSGEELELISEDELSLKGPHNMQNVLAASALALFAGAKLAGIQEALRSFAPLEHRIEPCGQWRGIRFINDSKATNVDATLAAIRAFSAKREIYLLGGEDKSTELDELGAALKVHAKAVVCFGDAAERFEAELAESCKQGEVKLCRADHLRDALLLALSLCEAGDTVILSPACASHDEFSSFEERGRVFKQLVAALEEGGIE